MAPYQRTNDVAVKRARRNLGSPLETRRISDCQKVPMLGTSESAREDPSSLTPPFIPTRPWLGARSSPQCCAHQKHRPRICLTRHLRFIHAGSPAAHRQLRPHPFPKLMPRFRANHALRTSCEVLRSGLEPAMARADGVCAVISPTRFTMSRVSKICVRFPSGRKAHHDFGSPGAGH